MGTDEEGTLAGLKTARKAIVEPLRATRATDRAAVANGYNP
jgi:hypothetical protein